MHVRQTKNPHALKVWDRIRIFAGTDNSAGEYEARVEDFINGGIVITQPVFVRGKTLLRHNMQVAVHFTRDDASYRFISTIRNRRLKGVSQMLLSPPTQIRRIQRRRFVRIEMNSRAAYAVIVPMLDWENWQDRFAWVDSWTLNISGGGVMIRTEERMAVDTLLLLRLGFFENCGLPENIIAVCRRNCEINKACFAGLEFILNDALGEYFDVETLARLPKSIRKFDPLAQEQLVSRIFYEQIELRRKGLI